nr:MAG TPA: hypothetical protein [Caudoviricetes sp.]
MRNALQSLAGVLPKRSSTDRKRDAEASLSLDYLNSEIN